jgi:hypothetical protein
VRVEACEVSTTKPAMNLVLGLDETAMQYVLPILREKFRQVTYRPGINNIYDAQIENTVVYACSTVVAE